MNAALSAYTSLEALELAETAHSAGFREALALVLEVAVASRARGAPEQVVLWLKGLLAGWPPGHDTADFDALVQLVRSARKLDVDRQTLSFRVQQLGALWLERGKEVAQSGKALKDDYTVGEGAAMQRCGDILLRSLGPGQR